MAKNPAAVDLAKRKEISDKVLTIGNADPQNIIRKDLGQLSFEISEKSILSIISFFKKLSKIDYGAIPVPLLDTIDHSVNSVSSRLNAMSLFVVDDNSPATRRAELYNDLQRVYKDAVIDLSPIIFAFTKEDNNEFAFETAQGMLGEFTAVLNDFKAQKDYAENELKEILDKSRQTASEIGVSVYAVHFQEEAEMHRKEAVKWLNALISLIVLTVIWGVLCFIINPGGEKAYQIVQFTIAKLIIISGLYYGLAMVSKNYKAHQHNYIVNRHKQNSLNSFESFVKGAGDDMQTKNAILLSATQSIFSSQTSGYSDIDGDGEPNKIIEIFKSVGQNKQG